MRTIAFVMSMSILSCAVSGSMPERDAGDLATPAFHISHSPDSAETTKIVLRSPRAKEACRACDGDWGMHSLSDATAETESCDCRTHDAGKRCNDGSDCQGMCVASIENSEYDVVELGPPARGFLVGRCSAWVTVFGCNALVARGARHEEPVLLAEPPPVLCVD